jgi:hypothetical protein
MIATFLSKEKITSEGDSQSKLAFYAIINHKRLEKDKEEI